MARRLAKGRQLLLSCLPVLVGIASCTTPAPPTASFTGSSTRSAAPVEDKIARGRFLVISHACGDCHGGGSNPAAEGWLDGVRDTLQLFRIGPFVTRPKNITPDVTTGIGSFTERQLFNSLRYGLRPEETPDVEITSTVPGQGNFPLHPHYLAVPMPWPAWRHMPDADLWAIAAYLKNGVRASKNKVQDSDGPPDFWASEYTVAKIGPYPATPFPSAREHSTGVATGGQR